MVTISDAVSNILRIVLVCYCDKRIFKDQGNQNVYLRITVDLKVGTFSWECAFLEVHDVNTDDVMTSTWNGFVATR